MKYTVRSGAKRHRLEIERESDFSKDVPVDVGRKRYTVRVHEQSASGELQLVAVNNRILSVQVRRRPDGMPQKVILNGQAYPVEIERVESTRFKPPVPEKKVDGTVRAYLPGQIVHVAIAAGEQVKKGQLLITLEAMKMENEIRAPSDGTVREILVQPRQLVAKGDPLVQLETVCSS